MSKSSPSATSSRRQSGLPAQIRFHPGPFQGHGVSKKSAAGQTEDDVLVVNGKDIQVVSAKDPAGAAVESAGRGSSSNPPVFSPTARKAKGHLTAGAKKNHHFRSGQGRGHHGGHGRER
jgi:hypothetical protein